MMDLEKFYLRLSEYIDSRFDSEVEPSSLEIPYSADFGIEDMFAEFEDFFGRDIFDEMEEFFNRDICAEMDEMVSDNDCCCTMYKTLCKTIELCHCMDEMDVPNQIHEKLFEVLEIEIED